MLDAPRGQADIGLVQSRYSIISGEFPMRVAMFVLTAGLVFLSASTRGDDSPHGWQFVGRTQAAVEVEVRARVTGELTFVVDDDGAPVKKGDVLAEIDPRTYQLDVDAAAARLRVAEAKLQVARIKSANDKKLLDMKVISPEEFSLSNAAETEAEAALTVAKVEVERAKLALSWTRVIAPIDGRASHIQVTKGSLVTANQSRILTVVSIDPLHISFNVPEALLLQLRRDGLAEPGKLSVALGFAGEEGFPHPAKFDLIESEVDPRIGAARFRATIPNPDGLLRPGMAVRVHLTAGGK
jgi:RND family efflux transporter MFP subunit